MPNLIGLLIVLGALGLLAIICGADYYLRNHPELLQGEVVKNAD